MKREMPWLLLALVYPTILASGYFVLLAGQGSIQQATYSVGKTVQFVVPFVLLWWWDGQRPRPFRVPSNGSPWGGLVLGFAFGLAVVVVMLTAYHLWLKHSPAFEATPKQAADKMTQLGLDTPRKFFLFAFFISIPHALLEELYWRWFVFGRLSRHVPFAWASALSSLGFAAHHVIVLAVYIPHHFWEGVVPLSLCIVVGGAVWAWMYRRTGTLYASWLSHSLVDMGLFVVGYDLLKETMFGA